MNLDSLRAALDRALADPGVRADAAACPVRVELVLVEAGACDADGAPGEPGKATAARRLVLWRGAGTGNAQDYGAATSAQPAHITCHADMAVWSQAFSPLPPVSFQSFGALRRQPALFRVAGSDLHWAQALPLMERLLVAMRSNMGRGTGAATGTAAPLPPHLAALPHLQGRYLPLADGSWVYTEQCGAPGAPTLLMLHTAGADSRQWHGLMAQPELRQAWRMLAFDLPGHGRSPLPPGEANWTWQLDQDRYLGWVLHTLDALQLDRVALMGCSMGAAIGLPLLARHADRFHGAILLETPHRSPGRRSPYLNHAQVHGARLAAAWVGALLSPHSPAAGRDHATWIYSQAAPGVYDGDLAFYSDQFDARQHTAAIDTTRTPLWLLTGDYDYSATPADTRRVADAIPGARFQTLPGFGHFPMVENPDGLMPHLREPLAALQRHIRTHIQAHASPAAAPPPTPRDPAP